MILFQFSYSIYTVIKNYFSSTAAAGNPVGIPIEAMMTMATSTVDRTTSWCQSLPTTISTPSFTVQLSNVSKFDDCDKKNSCSTNLKVLREIPTRISQKNFHNDVIDALVDNDGATAQNTYTTTTLPPTTLEGPAAPLPYQLEIAAITAMIARMKQCNAETPIH